MPLGGWGSLIGAGIGLIGSMDNSGNSTTTQNSVPPEFSGLASQVGQMGQQFGQLPYQPYPYAQVAPFNPYQYMGFDMTANRAFGSQLPQQAENALTGQLQGQKNPYADAQTQVGSNPYAGSNPFLDNAIGATLGDMSKQFNLNVAPSLAAQSIKGGSFGNTGQQEGENALRSDLAQRQLQTAGNMRMQDYGMQQGLAESDINRRVSAQQNDLSRNSGAYENMFGRQMQGLGMAPSIYSLGYQPGQQLGAIGSTMQQQGQNEMNAQYGQFQEAQNWPFKIFDTMRSPFGGINPGGTSTQTGPAGSPVAGLLGGAMLGNKLGQGFQWGSTQPPAYYGDLGGGAGNYNWGGGF
jgi:hypothetical protein